MKSFDFEAVVIESAVYCVGCVGEGTDIDNDPEVTPIFADSEWDSYPVCFTCNREHDYVSLTEDGWRARSRRHWSPQVTAMLYRADHAGGLGGTLPAFTSVGCYPMFYLEGDSDVICAKCANDIHKELDLTSGDVHWEGEPLVCDECGDEIESAYGAPDSDG